MTNERRTDAEREAIFVTCNTLIGQCFRGAFENEDHFVKISNAVEERLRRTESSWRKAYNGAGIVET